MAGRQGGREQGGGRTGERDAGGQPLITPLIGQRDKKVSKLHNYFILLQEIHFLGSSLLPAARERARESQLTSLPPSFLSIYSLLPPSSFLPPPTFYLPSSIPYPYPSPHSIFLFLSLYIYISFLSLIPLFLSPPLTFSILLFFFTLDVGNKGEIEIERARDKKMFQF